MPALPCVYSSIGLTYNSFYYILGGDTYNGGKISSGAPAAAAKPKSAPVAAKVPTAAAAKPAAAPASVIPPAKTAAPARAAPAEQENHPARANASANADMNKELASLRQTNAESTRAYAELRTEMEGLEKERDFYFEKLRDIEIVLQDLEDKGEGTPLSAALFKILYATADGFEPLANAAEEPIKSVDVYPESVSYDDNQESY